ncbi:hypothetical protein JQC92_11655 [Shewanella sp. 202IG2-18]|uniref:hypothetical protein n=1 Tax=Parashewanella hymeniacidonis TaxID=2807618 RepID=UPI001961E9E1|nr:hypothetical protein [Parashewanella hymeniacidonis]MBM7072677.1 hypothetical protein [Parashewanella hymeniacidonis]
MKLFILILVLMFSKIAMSNEFQLITESEAVEIENTLEAGSVESDELTKSIDIGNGVSTSYSFSITSKGNGGIDLLGTTLKLYDQHDDSIYIKGGLLQSHLVDLNDDGYLDILLKGIAIYTGEKGDLNEERPVKAILHYSPTLNVYNVVSKSEEIGIWLAN